MNEPSKWEKLPPIKGSIVCLTCGYGSHDILSMDALLGVGFGDCSVTKDGQQVYSEYNDGRDIGDLWKGADAEVKAAEDPDHDWRIHFFAPLYEAEYQRQGDKHWVLVRKGEGFA